MSSRHYPRQQPVKSEQGGTRWYPAHRALDTSTPHSTPFPWLSQERVTSLDTGLTIQTTFC